MNQKRIIIGAITVVVLAVIAIITLTEPEPQAPVTAQVALPAPPETGTPAAEKPAEPAEAETTQPVEPAAPAQPAAEPSAAPVAEPQVTQTPAPQVAAKPKATEAEAPRSEPPSFDVVRVERSGEAVIAGRAAPGSVVTVMSGARALAQVTADRNGQWALVLSTPLEPGSHELSLESRSAEGAVLLSDNVVVVSVPRPQVAAAEAVQAQAQAAPTQSQETPQAQATAQTLEPEPEPSAPKVVAREPAPAEAPSAGAQAGATQPAAATQEPIPAVASQEPAPASGVQVAAVEQPAPAEPPTAAVPTAPTEPSQTEPTAASAPRLVQEMEQALAVLMPRSGEGRIRILQQPQTSSAGLGEGTLILETVDYDAQGRASVGGRAAPGARLIIYLDNKPAAHALAGADGHWTATLARSVKPGLHRLRVDQLDAAGRVAARVETPFSRAVLAAALPTETAVIVQPGNSLWRISRRIYGEGMRYSVIYQANQEQIRDPDLIYPGQIFVLPSTN